jgi:hypothetical protein
MWPTILERLPAGECTQMKLISYQALLANQQNVAIVRSRKREVERAGGRVTMAPPTKVGVVLVILELPEGYSPDQFFPGLPFYPM